MRFKLALLSSVAAVAALVSTVAAPAANAATAESGLQLIKSLQLDDHSAKCDHEMTQLVTHHRGTPRQITHLVNSTGCQDVIDPSQPQSHDGFQWWERYMAHVMLLIQTAEGMPGAPAMNALLHQAGVQDDFSAWTAPATYQYKAAFLYGLHQRGQRYHAKWKHFLNLRITGDTRPFHYWARWMATRVQYIEWYGAVALSGHSDSQLNSWYYQLMPTAHNG